MVPGQMIGIVITIMIAPGDDGLFSLLSTAIVITMIVMIGLIIGRVARDRTGRYLYHWVPNLSNHCVQVS